MRHTLLSLFVICSILLITGCKGKQVEPEYPESSLIDTFEMKQQTQPRVTGWPKSPIQYTSFRKLFNDLNDRHLASARKNGIEPLESLDEARQLGFWNLAKIDSCEYFTVDKLTHSIPYLTPKTKWLLMTIGKNFNDSLMSRGTGGRQIILTSALRSDESIRSLRRRNTNASENSAHRYGTTFDIAYNRYNVTDSTYTVPSDRLRLLLGEVLYDLRQAHKCYVKYEIRQGCFHITAR
ncbi:DUF5715 family protein [Barnesiella sp. An55]|uniref:DUF5715 family protein n=1 Tax=Barnesiella sp. An55 TaxID=1965646 RepID=UPI000B374A1E|nr:DUF5715 family protein [Barnesiella sp. An55]OUN74398.1 hypothetical protein B5G10_02230 [Barnesiella sp. An55]